MQVPAIELSWQTVGRVLQVASLEADPPMGSDWTETELRRMRALSGALQSMQNAAPFFFSGVVLVLGYGEICSNFENKGKKTNISETVRHPN